MKIAVFGWYGHDNAGDERIKFCLNHFLMNLGGIEKVDFFDLHENAIKGKTNQFDHYDLVIIGGGGLILSRHNYHDFIHGINTILITAGISVETELKGNPKKFALSLLEKSSVVIMRDQESANKLLPYDPFNKVKVSSDLTFLEPYATRKTSKNNNLIGINLLPKPKKIKYSALANPYLGHLLQWLQQFGFKNPLKIVDYKRIIKELESHFHLFPIPLYCVYQKDDLPLYQKNDVEFLKLYFSNVPSFFSDMDIDNCSAFLSMRLHGSIFAVQKGTPVVSFSYLPKNRNFMREAGLEDFVIDSNNPKKITPLIEEVLNNQEGIQEKMAIYKEKATNKIRKDLLAVLNSIK